MSQDDEFEYEERATSPLDRKSALDRSQHFPSSAKGSQWRAARGDVDVTMDMFDASTRMDVDEEEEDLPPPRLVQQKKLSRAPSPIFEADVKQTRASSSPPQTKGKAKAKAQPAPTKTTRNTRSSKVQEQLPSEDSIPSDSSEPPPARKAAGATKQKRWVFKSRTGRDSIL